MTYPTRPCGLCQSRMASTNRSALRSTRPAYSGTELYRSRLYLVTLPKPIELL